MQSDSLAQSGCARKDDAGFEKLCAEPGKIVGPCERNTQQGQVVGGEEFVHEVVATDSVGAVVRRVVEFDGAQDTAGGRFGEDEVDVLP